MIDFNNLFFNALPRLTVYIFKMFTSIMSECKDKTSIDKIFDIHAHDYHTKYAKTPIQRVGGLHLKERTGQASD